MNAWRCDTKSPPPMSVFAAIAAFLLMIGSSAAISEDEPTKPAKKPAPVPRVLTKAEESRRGSDFLRPPGASRYDSTDEDWQEIPAWRKTEFFGIRARGRFFVYVVDCSGSMIDENRLVRAKDEVRRSILRLIEPQRFQVIFYNDEAIPMPGDLPRSADLASKSQLLAWMRLIEPDGETDPRRAMELAFAVRPDAVFLLTDGEFPAGVVEAIARKNSRKIPVHCVDLGRGAGGDQLKLIASQSGGKYVLRPWAGP